MAALLPTAAQASTTHHESSRTTHGVSHSTHRLASNTHKSSKSEHRLTRTASTHHSESKARLNGHTSHAKTHYASTKHSSHYRQHQRMAEFRHSRLQCVPYAREVSHIQLSGDAFLWWAQAAGRYERGNMPVVGSVLNFRSIGRMPLGHVAVVTAVLDSRTILVTQANWVPGTITNDVTVQDVSPDNNWTQVRVELGGTTTMGSVYPTYGFIYDRPATGTVIASGGGRNEVAEAPISRPVAAEAPNRNLQ
ncbi:CHAP domain-containing protein [Acidocella sp.]|uniref:CHAP domain-containing protein n=1 Tax=Acidocella sp. TaxID=50710 RepID=UPI003CFFF64E